MERDFLLRTVYKEEDF